MIWELASAEQVMITVVSTVTPHQVLDMRFPHRCSKNIIYKASNQASEFSQFTRI